VDKLAAQLDLEPSALLTPESDLADELMLTLPPLFGSCVALCRLTLQGKEDWDDQLGAQLDKGCRIHFSTQSRLDHAVEAGLITGAVVDA